MSATPSDLPVSGTARMKTWDGDLKSAIAYARSQAPIAMAMVESALRVAEQREQALRADLERATEASEGVSHALESLVDPEMAHVDPARAARIVAEMVDGAVDQNTALARWVKARRVLMGAGRPRAGTVAARQAGEEYAAAEDALYALACQVERDKPCANCEAAPTSGATTRDKET